MCRASEDVNCDTESTVRAHCGCLINAAPRLRVAIPAGETPSLAAKGLDRNVLQRDGSAGVHLVSGETCQADRTSGVAAVVQAEPLASAGFSRHTKIVSHGRGHQVPCRIPGNIVAPCEDKRPYVLLRRNELSQPAHVVNAWARRPVEPLVGPVHSSQPKLSASAR